MKRSARVALHEHPTLVQLEVDGVIPPHAVEGTHAEALSYVAFFSLLGKDVVLLLFRVQ